MKRKKAERIAAIYLSIEKGDPNISTERLLETVSQQSSRIFNHWIDIGDVCEAMAQIGHFKETKP